MGDGVLAIGNPLGFGMSVSAGIVSAVASRHPRHAVRRLHPDRRGDQSRQFRRSAGKSRRGRGGCRYGALQPRRCWRLHWDRTSPSLPRPRQFVVRHMLDPQQPRPGWIGVKLQDLTPYLARGCGFAQREGRDHRCGGARRTGRQRGASTRRYPAGHRQFQGDQFTGIHAEHRADPDRSSRRVLSVWRDGKEYTASATVAEWPKIAPEGGADDSHGRRDERAGAASRRAACAPDRRDAQAVWAERRKLTGALVASVKQYARHAISALCPAMSSPRYWEHHRSRHLRMCGMPCKRRMKSVVRLWPCWCKARAGCDGCRCR